MREYFDFDCVPYEEVGQQLGEGYNPVRARKEARTLVNQLIRHNPAPAGISFRIASNPHDFGNYYSVQVVYNIDSEEHANYVNQLENNFPAQWDEESKMELGL
jgi:hypothetical protein